MADRVFLIGMMASGKSTVGRQLAARLGWSFLDSDEQVERNTGRNVREIFETDGEPAFRAQEKLALHQAAAWDEPVVVAVAGGAVLDEDNRAVLRERGLVVWLDAPPDVLARRVSAGEDHRPLLGDDPAAALRRLDGERRPVYAELADVVIDVSVEPSAAIVARVAAAVQP